MGFNGATPYALFRAFPALAQRLPQVDLGNFPTPVARVDGLAHEAVYLKRDDLTGLAYGGNKVRKLELLLAQAKAQGAQAVLTFGAAGSNHALATAIYGEQAGLRVISMLVPQQNEPCVRRNLLRAACTNAELHYFPNSDDVAAGVVEQQRRFHIDGEDRLYIIPAGGSSPLGAVGFVNAVFELREQVAQGLLPEPDVIYAASGTMGTTVGLALGLALARMKTRVEAIAVTSPPYTVLDKAHTLFAETQALLRNLDSSIPVLDFPEARFTLRQDFLGDGYGIPSAAGSAAVARIKELTGISLEDTYTGKAAAAMLHDIDTGTLRGQCALFWNTYNSRNFDAQIKDVDYHTLPEALHGYFQQGG